MIWLKTKVAKVCVTVASAAVLAVSGLGISSALAASPAPAAASNIYGCVTGSTRTLEHVFTVEKNFVNFLAHNKGKCPNGFPFTVETNSDVVPPTPTPTPTTPTPTPTTPTPTPTTPTPTPTSTDFSCVVHLGDNCGAYDYPQIPMSNGFDTYVSNQDVGANSGTTETLYANNPGDWKVVADAVPHGFEGVQTFPDVQQLTNDYNPTTKTWGNGDSDTPLSDLATLKINYAETGPTSANSLYEFAPDIWTEGYPSDVMFWVDTRGRCNDGAFGGTVLGTATFGGQTWTVNRYGGPGAEIIFVLDSDPNTPNSCAHQQTGSVDIKAGFDWLVAHGIMTNPVFTQLNTGWEITSADSTTFTMSNYSITATTK